MTWDYFFSRTTLHANAIEAQQVQKQGHNSTLFNNVIYPFQFKISEIFIYFETLFIPVLLLAPVLAWGPSYNIVGAQGINQLKLIRFRE